jgi:hypothetical protein
MGNCCVKNAVGPIFPPNETSGLLYRPFDTSEPTLAPGSDPGVPGHVGNNNHSVEEKEPQMAEQNAATSKTSDEFEGPPQLFSVGDDASEDEEDKETKKNPVSAVQPVVQVQARFHDVALDDDLDGLPIYMRDLRKYLKVPIPYINVDRIGVELVIHDAFDNYNIALGLLNQLRTHRKTLIDWARPQVAQTPVTLQSAMIHLATLLKPNLVVQMWRNGLGDLEMFYNIRSIISGDLRDRLFAIGCAINCINKLEVVHEKNNPLPQVERVARRRLGPAGMDNEIQEVHANTADGERYLKTYWEAVKLVEDIPTLWRVLNKEKNDLILEFLKGFRYIMAESVELSRPPKD